MTTEDRKKTKEQLIAELAALRAHLAQHEPAIATTEDEVDSLSAANGRGVAASLRGPSRSALRQAVQGAEHLPDDLARAITNSMGEGVYALDTHGRVTFANPSCQRLLGYSEAELLGQDMHELIHFQHADGSPFPADLCPLTSVLLSGATVRQDYDVFTRKDGTLLPVAYTSAPIARGDVITGAVLTFHDISDRQRSEQRLAVQYAVSQVLGEAADLGAAASRLLAAIGQLLEWDLGILWLVENTQLRCMETWQASTATDSWFADASRRKRFKPGEGLPGRVWQAGAPVAVEDVLADGNFPRLRAADTEGLHGAFAFPIQGAHGPIGVIEFFGRVMRTPDSSLLQAVASVGNQVGQFIERTRAEAALREGEARKGAVLETALDAVISMDSSGHILDFNPAAERMFGYTRAEVVGHPLAERIIPPSLRHRHRAGLARYLATREPHIIGKRVELIGLRADGSEFPIELAVTGIEINGNPLFTAYIRDITERTRTEALQRTLLEREQRARAEAEEAQSRLAFLAEASVVLASSLDYNATISSVVHLAVPRLADFCYVDVLDDDTGTISRLDVAHVDPAKEQALRSMRTEVPLTPNHPVSQVFRTGRPQVVSDVSDEMLVAASPNQQVLNNMRSLGIMSYIAMPIASRERVLGVLMLVSAGPGRHYGSADLALADELARRTALAIDNARLYQRMEAALREVEEVAAERRRQAAELTTIIEAMPDGVFVCDPSGQLVRVSKHGAAMLGITDPDALRHYQEIGEQIELRSPDGSFMPPEDYPLAQALRGITRTDFRMLLRQRDSGRDLHVLTSFAPIRDREGNITGAVAVGGDVTELYRLERQKEEFLSIASHELKTPLTTLKILTQLTHRRLSRAALAEAEQTARMERAIVRMERLVNDLLDASRIESGKLALNREPMDLVALCRQIAEEQHAATGRTIELDLPAHVVEVNADSERIGQVLTNLVSNALKYSPATTSVWLQLTRSDGEARACVRDAGPTIPASALPRLFERFYRVPGMQVQSGSGVGLGLGLYISRDIITRHGGCIWAENQDEAGVTFCFTLPLPG